MYKVILEFMIDPVLAAVPDKESCRKLVDSWIRDLPRRPTEVTILDLPDGTAKACQNQKPTWSDWIAMRPDDGDDVWHIAPKEFWIKYSCCPDWHQESNDNPIDLPSGFDEVQEHGIMYSGAGDAESVLKSAGFEILDR